jgi:6-phosphogluconolactonase
MTSKRKPQIIVAANAEELAKSAAERLLARIAQSSGAAAICLTGGSTPEPLYALLKEEPYRSRVPWQRIHWFMGDDRFVPLGDRRSNMGAAKRIFLDHVSVPAENIHPIPTGAADPGEAARAYENELKRFYGRDKLDLAQPLFQLVLMGLGVDGHTASHFPHAPPLDEGERWVIGIEQAGMEPFVSRVTLTFSALASTREMLFIVSGAEKREIVARVLAGEALPAARAWSNGDLVWLIDRAAAPEGQGGS